MSRRYELVFTILGDVAVLSAIYFISWKASASNTPVISWHSIIGNLIVLVFWFFLFQSFDLYEPRYKIQLMNEMFKLFRVLCLGAAIILGLGFLVNIDFIKARGYVPAYLVLLPSVIAWRFFWRGLVGEYIKPQREKVLIFQNGDAIEDYSHFNVVEKVKLDKVNPTIPKSLLTRSGVEGIVIESNGHHEREIYNIISGLTDTDYEIFVSPRLYPMVYQYFLVQKVPESPYLKIIFNPLSGWDQFLKRVIDIGLALLVLFAFWPFLLLISIFIKLDSPGPVLYKQQRVGHRGKEFTLYKFRSMISDAEKYTGPVWAEKNDKRITRIGRVLRPLRLDEWPQLLNVLQGDMSFVGPRPERPAFVERFRKVLPLYNLRLNVHPGITGWAQVKGSYDESIEDVKRKLEHDLQYVNDMSLRLDLKIFLKTVLTVLKKQGAH